jgi:ribonuclease HI
MGGTRMKFYCDGSGWNGKTSRWLVTDENKKILADVVSNVKKTNNECEYLAVIEALKLVNDGDIIYTDSKLVEGQLVWLWRVNHEHLRLLNDMANILLKSKQGVKIVWINREQNIAGQILEKK